MALPPSQAPSWRDKISKEQRSQLFKVVWQALKKQDKLATKDEKEIQNYALKVMQDHWRNAQSKDDFLRRIADIAQQGSSQQNVGGGGILPQQVPPNMMGSMSGLPPGMMPTMPNTGVPPTGMQQMKPGLTATISKGVKMQPNQAQIANRMAAAQQQMANQVPSNASQMASQQAQPQVSSEDLAEKFWEKIDSLTKYKQYIDSYIESFEQKMKAAEREYVEYVESMKGKEPDKKKKEESDKKQMKYRDLKDKFLSVRKQMNSSKSERELEVIDRAKYLFLESIESSLENVRKEKEKQVAAAAASGQGTSGAGKPAPSTPPIDKQRTKDASKSFLETISAMEREYPSELQANLRQLLANVNIIYESSIFDVFTDALDAYQEAEEVENDRLSQILGKRKRIAFCPDDEVPSIQTTSAFYRHDSNGSLKRLRLREPSEDSSISLNNDYDPSIVEYIDRYIQNNVVTNYQNVKGASFSIEKGVNNKYSIHCTISSESVQRIPELVVTIAVHTNKNSEDDMIEYLSMRFLTTKIDDANSIFTAASSQFEKEMSTKYGGYVNSDKTIRISHVFNYWIACVDRILQASTVGMAD